MIYCRALNSLGIIDVLCRGVLYFLVLGSRLYSVCELPIFSRLRLFLKKSA